jgi:hypothetical protein
MSEISREKGPNRPKNGPDDEPVKQTAAPADKLVTRTEVARVLRKSVSTIRRMEGTVLEPVVGSDGVHRFRYEEVRQLQVIPPERELSPGDYDCEMAAAAFALFDDEADPIDVVIRLRYDPRAVSAMYEEWTRMRGALFVPADVVAKLEYYVTESVLPLADANALLDAIAKMLALWCESCRLRSPVLCVQCAAAMSSETLKRHAARCAQDADARAGRRRNVRLKRLARDRAKAAAADRTAEGTTSSSEPADTSKEG